MRTAHRLAVAVSLASLILIPTRVAQACLWVDCGNAALAAGPANVPVLVHVTDERQRGTTPSLELRDDAGHQLVVSVTPEGHAPGVWLVRPTTPLSAGAVVTTRVPSCPSKGEEISLSAKVGPVAAEATAAGTIAKTDVRVATAADLLTLGCTDGAASDARALDVRLAPDPSVAPYLPISVVELQLDGKPFVDPVRGLPAVGSLSTTLVARCDGNGGIAPTAHDLEVRVWIPDHAAPLSVRTRVDLSCTAEPHDEDSAACTSAPGRPGRAGLALAAVAAVAFARRRRRTKAATPAPHGVGVVSFGGGYGDRTHGL